MRIRTRRIRRLIKGSKIGRERPVNSTPLGKRVVPCILTDYDRVRV